MFMVSILLLSQSFWRLEDYSGISVTFEIFIYFFPFANCSKFLFFLFLEVCGSKYPNRCKSSWPFTITHFKKETASGVAFFLSTERCKYSMGRFFQFLRVCAFNFVDYRRQVTINFFSSLTLSLPFKSTGNTVIPLTPILYRSHGHTKASMVNTIPCWITNDGLQQMFIGTSNGFAFWCLSVQSQKLRKNAIGAPAFCRRV